MGFPEHYHANIPAGTDPRNGLAWERQKETVNSPDHYNKGGVEVIDFIDQIGDGYTGKDSYYVGNIIKYVSRAPHKGGIEDLRKAEWHIRRLIDIYGEREELDWTTTTTT